MWQQSTIQLPPLQRGFHLITEHVEQALVGMPMVQIGQVHLFIKHTSASLTLNENYDPSVRRDMEDYFLRMVPESVSLYQHNDEGLDDMPAHIKSSLLGASLLIPVTDGRLLLGTWQGIYLGEHRHHGGSRTIILTLQGQ
ncbi:MAG: secondary thiamine-phosphate synthase enzyme YjbQ [Gammaproteobacteria bacterium]|nr:secondary thiamine-phosphate synthase enzyme YjbQ [Gammaproteobacteria bacterium]